MGFRLGSSGVAFVVMAGFPALFGSLAEEKRVAMQPVTALPVPPAGCQVREVFGFSERDQEPVRIAAHPRTGLLYVLGGGGDVTVIDPKAPRSRAAAGLQAAGGSRAAGFSPAGRCVLRGSDYIEQPKRQNLNIPLPIDRQWVNAPITLRATLCLGLTFDRKSRLYVVANVQIPGKIVINRVDIYRCASIDGMGVPSKPELWTRFDYPYGIGGFNHGACRIVQGPDGLIYLGSGSRTDHGEAGEDASLSKLGEAPHPDVPGGPDFAGGDFTASILRFDPEKGQQTPEVFSRGNRNPFGFDWDDKGRLIDAEHGPMADHPEELNYIQQGKHYGFPYVFGNQEKPNYPDSPPPPPGLRFEPPIKNLGPGGLLGDHPMYSMTPHAAPGGMIFYRTGRLPKQYENSFFLARFGNLVNYNRIGFDVLSIRLEEKDGELIARTERFLDRLARPIDLCVSNGKLYILEYCRQTETSGPGSEGYNAPGRVLEVTGKE
jgi:glucose/arabinose dehydrogenase